MRIGMSSSCFYPQETEASLRRIGEAGAKTAEIFFNAPSELEAVALSHEEAYLEWRGVVSASSYKIERSLDGVTWSVLAASHTDDYYIDDTLTAQTTYYYRVSSVNRAGVSEPSDFVSIT